MSNIVHTHRLTAEQKIAVSLLWNQEYPHQVMLETLTDLDAYLDGLSDLQHILYISDELLGWAFKFRRDGERWFAIIIDSSIQQKGIGTLLLNELKKEEEELNGWVINHDNYKKADTATYRSPLPFYTKNGFNVFEQIQLETAQLSGVKIVWRRF